MSLARLARYGLTRAASGGPPPPTGYRYHRLVFAGNNGRSTINVAEVEFRESVGGANAATGGTAFATSAFSNDFLAAKAFDANTGTFWSSGTVGGSGASAASTTGGFPASNAFDGSASTFWASSNTVTATTLTYDFNSGTLFADVTAYRIRARADANDGSPKDWTLQYSDNGSTWTTAHTATNQTGWSNGEEREYTFSSVGARRYWRLNITTNNGRSTINIAEVVFVGYGWGTVALGYDMGSGNAVDVVQYAIRARSDANDGSPSAWSFEGSDDGSSWTVLDTVTGETGWSNGELRTFTV